jgi:hypothetical protein
MPEGSITKEEHSYYNEIVAAMFVRVEDYAQHNPKVAYFSFKIVEQIIKRAFLQTQVARYMPFSIATLDAIKQNSVRSQIALLFTRQ